MQNKPGPYGPDPRALEPLAALQAILTPSTRPVSPQGRFCNTPSPPWPRSSLHMYGQGGRARSPETSPWEANFSGRCCAMQST